MGVCQNTMNIPDYSTTQEPSIQKIHTFKVNRKYAQIIPEHSFQYFVEHKNESLPSDHDFSDQEVHTFSKYSSKNSHKSKSKSISIVNSKKQSLFTQKAKIRKINSFAFEEDQHSNFDEDSLLNHQTLMDVNLKFKHEAFISIQKILETNQIRKSS